VRMIKYFRIIFLAALVLLLSSICTATNNCDNQSAPLDVVVFYSPGCPGCEDVLKALAKAKKTFGDKIASYQLNIDELEAYEILIKYEEHYDSTENATLKIFLGDTYLASPGKIVKDLNKTIEEQRKKNSKTFFPEDVQLEKDKPEEIPPAIIKRFKSFKILPVLGAGLIDGINPCAFTSIVFLFSFLTYLKKSKFEILIVGLFFALGTFLTYLLLGFGAVKALKIVSLSRSFSQVVTYVVAAATFVLAGLSLRDYIVYKKTGKAGDMKLSLPKAMTRTIHKVTRSSFSSRNLVLAGFIAGVLVSLLEAICTGQVYLPTIIFVLKDPALKYHAYLYLILYNLMFIAPLLAVTALLFLGLSSKKLVKYAENRLGMTKLLMTALFFALGLLILLV
jgi:cytochrome c biogenesis protein CcdA